MEEKPKEESSSGIQSEENHSAVHAYSVVMPETSKPEKKHKFRPNLKKPLRWIVAGVLVVAIAGLLASCFMLYKKSNDLSERNKNLNSTIDSFKKANAKPDKLTDVALQPITSDIKDQPAPAPADSGSFGGTAVQVNADDPNSANPKYIGGEYAPYWLLTKFALTIPNGTKMVRATDVSTDGHLLTVNNEGGAGCGGEGIYMTVSSTLTVPGSTLRAWGSSASYERGVGCGGADPIVAVYVKYYPMAKTSQYKYMELVTADCSDHDDKYDCIASSADKTKWRLYSGIVLANAPAYKVGGLLQGNDIAKQLYNRDKNGAQFYIDCSSEKYARFNCTAEDYKNKDYTTALKDSNYIQFKNIIQNMHEH
jgi:hypothetical protein